MGRFLTRLLLGCACLAGAGTAASAAVLRVENATGSVSVRSAAAESLTVRRSCPVRPNRDTDVRISRAGGLVTVEAAPLDGARIDLEIELPYRFELEVNSARGAVSVRGFLPRLKVRTESGEIHLALPWKAMRLEATAAQAPLEVALPAGLRFRQERRNGWSLQDRLPAGRTVYGAVTVRADRPARLTLEDIPIPEEAPVKLPWQAGAIVAELLRPLQPGPPGTPAMPEPTSPAAPDHGALRFSADVRLVNLTVSVFDSEGHPAPGLRAEDFEVWEDGVRQRLAAASSEEAPFNLALLLDLSGSTQRDRAAMKAAARRFLRIARPQDRLAVYAMANDLFQVISPLTGDRERLESLIDAIPDVGGGSPLYDTLAVAYAQEFRRRPAERNALIVISDGIDNRLHGADAPAAVPFPKLLRAVRAMNVILYPVLLDPFTRVPPPAWAQKAREQMEALARASGGRLFPARSLEDLEPVYPLVAQELRSVYTLAYYPAHQTFDGRWRRLEVKVRRPHLRIRARSGYFAR
jgi:Ca-activated chloride channel family protein